MNFFQKAGRKNLFLIGSFVFVILFLYLTLRILFFDSDPVIPLILKIFNFYISFAESQANVIFRWLDSDAYIKDRVVHIVNHVHYKEKFDYNLEDWTQFLLFKRRTAFILLLIWVTFSSLKKKLFFSGILLIVHFVSVVAGLVILAEIAPLVNDELKDTWIIPWGFGVAALMILFAVWHANNRRDISITINRLKVNSISILRFPEEKVGAIIITLLIYTLLSQFITPLLNLEFYGRFLAKVTGLVLALADYQVYAEGNFLYGPVRAVIIGKICFGIGTMFVFSSLVYITGKNIKARWVFIILGLAFINVINIIRIAHLFIFAQKGNEQFSQIHTLYMYIVYGIVFILWVIWFERFADRTLFIKPGKQSTRAI